MQIYLVGGAVRDALLGRTGGDRDWVVVGATPEALLAQGYLPVGKDFPVFLHPRTHEEYALARTERKTAPGYHGFAVHAAIDVTLEQDLARRDLTINSIAASASAISASGQLDVNFSDLTDPYGGQRDLHAKVLRHVTDAFREDPVRILRVARFAARFADFTVAPETMDLMRAMVAAGEVDALVPERVWQELARGLMEPQPSRMFAVLRDCGALERLLPKDLATDLHAMPVLDTAARLHAPLPVRFACWQMHGVNSGSDPYLILRVPTDCRDLAVLALREKGNIHQGPNTSAAALQLLEQADALRKPQRFADALLACECDARGRGGAAYPQRQNWLTVLQAAQSVATEPIAKAAQAQGVQGKAIGDLVHAARVAAIHDTGLCD
jgi:tRNA nucleotidyltransferase (CCA-adding enzyme)